MAVSFSAEPSASDASVVPDAVSRVEVTLWDLLGDMYLTAPNEREKGV